VREASSLKFIKIGQNPGLQSLPTSPHPPLGAVRLLLQIGRSFHILLPPPYLLPTTYHYPLFSSSSSSIFFLFLLLLFLPLYISSSSSSSYFLLAYFLLPLSVYFLFPSSILLLFVRYSDLLCQVNAPNFEEIFISFTVPRAQKKKTNALQVPLPRRLSWPCVSDLQKIKRPKAGNAP
jgi:hypothetical protein